MPSKIEVTIITECSNDCTMGNCHCGIIAENIQHFVTTLSKSGSMATLQRLLDAERQWGKLISDAGKKKAS